MRSKILIATPVYERADVASVALGYAAALWGLAAIRADDGNPMGYRCVAVDVVRARSRLVEAFLRQPEFSHLLFWDTDVTAPAKQLAVALKGMLRADRDIVGIPYPKKTVDLQAVADSGKVEHAHNYNIRKSEPSPVDASGCVDVDGVGAGFMLIKRECLEKMRAHYAGELEFDDETEEGVLRTVALFQLRLMTPPGRETKVLLSEDYSFCTRWTDMGGKVHLYLGPGAPLDHVGAYKFTGDIRALLTPRL